MARLSTRMGALTPERLTAILGRAEDGWLDDWSDLCDRMTEVDPEVRSNLETRFAAVAGSRWYVEPGGLTGDPARDELAADGAALASRALRGIADLEVHVQESLDGVAKGLAAHEIDWQWDGKHVMPAGLEWIHTRRFRIDPATWRPLLVDTGAEYVPSGIELDPDGWILHMPRSLAGYPTRSGVLRACAWPYLFRRWCMQFWVHGAESFAWPFLWAEVPRGSTEDVRAAALAGLEELSEGRRGVAEEGTAFRLLESASKDAGTWKQLNDTLRDQISTAILGMTDIANPGRIGAYAAVEVRRGTTVDARIAMDERALSSTWSASLLGPLMRLNAHAFGGVVPPTPRLRWSVASSRVAIPPELFPYVTDDEVRASIGLDPRPMLEPAGGLDVQGAALNGAQIASLQEILSAVARREMAPAAAKIAIKIAFPAISPEDAAAMVDAQAAVPAPVGESSRNVTLPT